MILIWLLKTQKQQITGTVSDEIVFETRILQDFFESVGNRVLSIDDMSEHLIVIHVPHLSA